MLQRAVANVRGVSSFFAILGSLQFEWLDKLAFLLRAAPFGAAFLGGLDGQDRPVTVRAGTFNRFVPHCIITLRVGRTGIENLAAPRFSLEHAALVALGTADPGIRRFLKWLDIFAVRVVAAADKFAIAPGADNQVRVALRAAAVFDHFRCSAFPGFIDITGIFTFRVAGATDKETAAAETHLQWLAAIRAFFLNGFRIGT